MKKSLLTLAVLGLTVAGSFAQGYFLFTASKGAVWESFSTGSPIYSSGNVYTSFLWANSGSFSSGIATNAAGSNGGSWSTVNSLLSGGFSVAVNAGNSQEVDVLSNTSALAKGGINYNSSATFQVANTVAGNSYVIVPVAWNSIGGATLSAALASGTQVGYGNSFTYASGASSLATPSSFTTSGMLPFGVAPVPEPTSFALAGIGAAAMMIFRRKK